MRRFLLLLLPLLILAGCSPEQQLLGKWRGKAEISSNLKSQMPPQASAFTDMFQPQLDLRPDKTFTLTLSVAPIDGTWKLENNVVTLTPKTVMGMTTDDVKKKAEKELDNARKKNALPFPMPDLPGTTEMKMTLNPNNEELTLDPGSGTMFAGFGKIVFTKV